MTWLKQNWFKASIILLILIIVIVAFYSYQDYLGRKTNSETMERLRKEEESRKEYIAKRKTDCLDIYKFEGAKWNNVRGWRYEEDSDLCYITYKDPNPKSTAECEKNLAFSKEISSPDPVPPSDFIDYLFCIEGTFEKSF